MTDQKPETTGKRGPSFFHAPRLDDLDVPHIFTTRLSLTPDGPPQINMGFKGDTSREDVLLSRRLACEAIGADPANLTVARQVHSGRAVVVEAEDVGKGAFGADDAIPNADGMVTDEEKAVLMILTADCVPVLLCDADGPVGAFHAGWRGALAGIGRNTVRLMRERFDTDVRELVAVIGPAIGYCCFEVGQDVAELFGNASKGCITELVTERDGKWFVDLPGFVQLQLLRSGLYPENVVDPGLCTCCRPDLFYSYRRDGRLVGSMGSVISAM